MDKSFHQERKLLNRLASKSSEPTTPSERTRIRPRLNDPLPVPADYYVKTSLSKIEESFVHYYTSHYNQLRAAVEAGYPGGRAQHYARQLLDRDDIKRSIAEIEHNRLKRLRVEGDYLLNRILQIALADPNELMQVRVPPCRYCYGKNNLYQRTYAEMERELEMFNRGWIKVFEGEKGYRRKKPSDPPFDEAGGAGYDNDLPPNPDCPECRGKGEASRPLIHYKDTRYLSPEGRALFAGAKRTRDGFEVVTRNQDAAWSFLARFAERWLEQKQQSVVSFNPEEMTTEELEQVLEQLEELQ